VCVCDEYLSLSFSLSLCVCASVYTSAYTQHHRSFLPCTTHASVCVRVCVYVPVRVCLCVQACMCVCMRVYVCINTHIHLTMYRQCQWLCWRCRCCQTFSKVSSKLLVFSIEIKNRADFWDLWPAPAAATSQAAANGNSQKSACYSVFYRKRL